jgi:3-deoxy-D-manno-octulosonic-acid transferase
MDHFREISNEVLSRGAGFRVGDAEEMILRAKTLLENFSLRGDMGKRGSEIIRDNRGATGKTLETIFRFL